MGLLAGENDLEAGSRSGDGREVNRHNFGPEEIQAAVGRSAVMRLELLIRLRNSHPAFDGGFEILWSAQHRVRLSWSLADQICTLDVDLRSGRSAVELTDVRGGREQVAL